MDPKEWEFQLHLYSYPLSHDHPAPQTFVYPRKFSRPCDSGGITPCTIICGGSTFAGAAPSACCCAQYLQTWMALSGSFAGFMPLRKYQCIRTVSVESLWIISTIIYIYTNHDRSLWDHSGQLYFKPVIAFPIIYSKYWSRSSAWR